MCGIFGFIADIDNPIDTLQRMGELQIHRGPDGKGSHHHQNVHMGMRRLSIIDVEHGQQPFFSQNGDIVAFCNGEIFNHHELREELAKDGITFKTQSDIEIIPHLYERHGLEFAKKLNGMFGMAIFDRNQGQLHLIRDPMGVKPVYFFQEGQHFAYSSELKSLQALPFVDRELDSDAISSFLDLMFIPTPMTPFQHIKKLEAGSILSVQIENINRFSNELSNEFPNEFSNEFSNPQHRRSQHFSFTTKKYWTPLTTIDENHGTSQLENCEDKFNQSVKRQLQTDVPLGFFLSGGIDSSAIVTTASKHHSHAMKTFHMKWHSSTKKRDESDLAAFVSEKFQTEHSVHQLKDLNPLSLLPQLIWHLDEPLADPAFIPTYLISKVASKDVKVILSGAGGDELFGGYPHHQKPSMIKKWILKVFFKKDIENSYYDRWKSFQQNKWKSIFPWFKADASKDLLDKIYREEKQHGYSSAIMSSDLSHYLQDDILMLTDKMTMAASIECRVPFLDHDFVETCQKIPSRHKFLKGTPKHLIHKFLKGLLPLSLFQQPKEGFGMPVTDWMNQYKEPISELMENGALKKHLGWKTSPMERLSEKPLNSKETEVVWKSLLLEIWLRIFVDEEQPQDIFPQYSSQK